MAANKPHVLSKDPLEGVHPDAPGFRQTLLDTFMQRPTGRDDMGSEWVGAKLLGKGGQGHAGLWVKVDPQTQKVVDRIVIKESALKQHHWNNMNFWFRPYDVPMESYIMDLLKHEPTNVVGIEATSVFPQTRTIRQYLEFCQLGDLWNNLQWPQIRDRQKLPEAYLWCVFEHLLRAAVTLQHPVGPLGPPGQWVVHLDLKPENVFLSLPDPNHFPRYPLAKVGDFGAAMMGRLGENQEHKFESIVHTPGYLPPEIWWRYNRNVYAQFSRGKVEADRPAFTRPVTAAANIWTIGLIMACLLNNDSQPLDINFTQLEDKDWTPPLDETYSPDIRKYIRACMYPDASRRPEAAKLLSRMPDKQMRFAYPMMEEKYMQGRDVSTHELVNKFKDTLFPVGSDDPKKIPDPAEGYSWIVPGVPDELGGWDDPEPHAGVPYSFAPGIPDALSPFSFAPGIPHALPPGVPAAAPEAHPGAGVGSIGGALAGAMDELMMDDPAPASEAPAAGHPAPAVIAAAEEEPVISASAAAFLQTYWEFQMM